MKNRFLLWALLLMLAAATSCQKFLEVKSSKALAVPSTVKDAQAVLDNYSVFNLFYSSVGAQSDDDFYLEEAYVNTLATDLRANYTWDTEAYNLTQWTNGYNTVFYANIALDALARTEQTPYNTAEYNTAKGTALFFRGYALWHIAQYWSVPYEGTTAATDLGIPLRLTPDANVVSTRATLAQTYGQVIADLKEAAALLPLTVPVTSRPSKAAAFAALARTYLSMREYSSAGAYADSCLRFYNSLIDYNTVSTTATAPFPRFNAEVLLQAQFVGTGMLALNPWKVDSTLYRSYAANDLRKSVFYSSNGTGTFGFKGDYSASVSSSHFNGLAVDEIYLIRAEARAREGAKEAALADLNALLVKRWKTGTFVPYTATDATDALDKILAERRKELVLRGLRWFDLRRLNKEPRYAKTLVRRVGATTYQLPPNDKRYTFYIPAAVIAATGMPQNER